jgi:hypothetical protein
VQTAVTYASEHVYPGPGKEAGAPTLILYAEIWTPEFAQAHRQLAQLAEEGKVRHLLCCSILHGDLDSRVCVDAQAAGPASRGGKGKTFFFSCSPLRGDLDARVRAGALAAGPASRGGKGKTFFLLFSSTWRSGRQSLRRHTGKWLSSQRRER